MRNLKFAILGLLNQSNMTGYDFMKEFESTFSEFWSAKHSQIYPELKKLTEEGCITYDVQITGVSLEKKVYTITEKGREELIRWLSTSTPMEQTPKDIGRLKIFFSGSLSPEARLALLNDQLSQHQERLAHLKNNQKKFVEIPSKDSSEFGDYLLLKGAIMREETTCRWLTECIELS